MHTEWLILIGFIRGCVDQDDGVGIVSLMYCWCGIWRRHNRDEMRPHATINISSEEKHQQWIGISYLCLLEAWVWLRRLQCVLYRYIIRGRRKNYLILFEFVSSRPTVCNPFRIRQQSSSSFAAIDQRRFQANNRWCWQKQTRADSHKHVVSTPAKMHSQTHCHCILLDSCLKRFSRGRLIMIY